MLRIATFNIENLDDLESPSLKDRLTVLRPILQRLNADVLCLQEINAQKHEKERVLFALQELIQGTAYQNFQLSHSLGLSGERLSDKHNLVTLSRFSIIEQHHYWHDLVKGPLYQQLTAYPHQENPTQITWDRPFLWAKLQLASGEHLHVINLHLRAPLASYVPGQKKEGIWQTISGWAEGFYIASMKRAGQALEARLLIDQFFDQDADAYVVVCGDFNAEEYEVPTRILCGHEFDTGNNKLASRSLIPLEHSVPKDRRFTVLHHGRPQMLDHILISRSLYARYDGFEIHNEAIGDELIVFEQNEQTAGSSHAPVVAKFKF